MFGGTVDPLAHATYDAGRQLDSGERPGGRGCNRSNSDVCLFGFHRGGVFTTSRRSVAPSATKQSLLR